MSATLDGEPLAQWESVAVKAGQELTTGFSTKGARSYLAFAGGIDVPPVLGSRATFHMAGVGGFEGHALKDGQQVPLNDGHSTLGRSIREECRPKIAADGQWTIEVVRGPNDDWVDDAGHRMFLESEWTLQTRCNRTGYRLTGPEWTFAERATSKGREHGEHPSNILDHGYPVGSVNLCGQTPIILVSDAPSAGGFINPYTVPSAAFWKLAQSKPNDTYRFREVSVYEAQALRSEIDRLCSEASLK